MEDRLEVTNDMSLSSMSFSLCFFFFFNEARKYLSPYWMWTLYDTYFYSVRVSVVQKVKPRKIPFKYARLRKHISFKSDLLKLPLGGDIVQLIDFLWPCINVLWESFIYMIIEKVTLQELVNMYGYFSFLHNKCNNFV